VQAGVLAEVITTVVADRVRPGGKRMDFEEGKPSREERRFPWKLRGSGTFFGVNVSASGYEFLPKNEPDPGA